MSRLPDPTAGLVIRYAYLWKSEHQAGRDDSVKDRPCAVVLSTTTMSGDRQVIVLPITHSPPRVAADAIEIPRTTKLRLGLDSDRSWIVLTEANRFIWPGPDLRFPPGAGPGQVAYGVLPAAFLTKVREAFKAAVLARRASLVARTE